ncbi:hypothetical protein PV11_08508 [Exophiala sideris]|uniref:NmrA-like domain-containing protein n=1 Tax=Exophiala sideris TaxID=1016849 RepID=A0A0D1X0T9_9EURO|nr:hypothetical protein PV11_08508 [Exophiala sideris]
MAVKVAIAGGTGNLGPAIVNALLNANYHVTVLTRKGSNSASKLPKHANISVAEVDYSSVESLTEALKGHKVVVSTVGTELLGGQNPLIDAAIAAGVTRFLPSEFGSNTPNPKSSQLPVFQPKVATQKYLKEKAAENPNFSYTLVINGPFFDWGIKVGFVANPAKHAITVYNGGDIPFSATNLDTIGQAVVGVIEHLDETKNRPVYIQSTATTQNQLIAYGKEKDGKDWDVTPKDTKQVYKESLAELQKGADGNIGAAMVGFIFTSVFEEGYGGNWSDKTDNELLGLKEMSDNDVKAFVQGLLPSSSSL